MGANANTKDGIVREVTLEQRPERISDKVTGRAL